MLSIRVLRSLFHSSKLDLPKPLLPSSDRSPGAITFIYSLKARLDGRVKHNIDLKNISPIPTPHNLHEFLHITRKNLAVWSATPVPSDLEVHTFDV